MKKKQTKDTYAKNHAKEMDVYEYEQQACSTEPKARVELSVESLPPWVKYWKMPKTCDVCGNMVYCFDRPEINTSNLQVFWTKTSGWTVQYIEAGISSSAPTIEKAIKRAWHGIALCEEKLKTPQRSSIILSPSKGDFVFERFDRDKKPMSMNYDGEYLTIKADGIYSIPKESIHSLMKFLGAIKVIKK